MKINKFCKSIERTQKKDGDRLNNDEINLYPTNKSGHRKAHSSLMQIGYALYKQGLLEFKNGEYRWM